MYLFCQYFIYCYQLVPLALWQGIKWCNCPPKIFDCWKIFENFLVRMLMCKNIKIWGWILSTHILICRKFATICWNSVGICSACWKVATICLPTSLTQDDAAGCTAQDQTEWCWWFECKSVCFVVRTVLPLTVSVLFHYRYYHSVSVFNSCAHCTVYMQWGRGLGAGSQLTLP